MSLFFRPAGLGLAAWLILAPAAGAQTGDPYTTLVRTVPVPYWGYARTPYGDALSGMADLTRATGTYHVRIQQAARQREETRQLKIKTRTEELKYLRWRQNYLWEMRQEYIQKVIKQEEKRAVERPELTEIVSGYSLNRLFEQLKRDSSQRSDSQPLKQEWLDAVNFESSGGHAGLLREKYLIWPAVLQEDRFEGQRRRIEGLLDQARGEVLKRRLPARTVKELLALHRRLDEEVTQEVTGKNSVWGPNQHILANRFLTELKQAILLLQNPKEARFLVEDRPHCKTAAELVRHMRENGLTFGPASAGNQRHYVALHDALAREVRAPR